MYLLWSFNSGCMITLWTHKNHADRSCCALLRREGDRKGRKERVSSQDSASRKKKKGRALPQHRGVYFMTSFGLGQASVASHILPRIMMNCGILAGQDEYNSPNRFLVTLLSIPRTHSKLFNIFTHISLVAKAVGVRDCKFWALPTEML